MKQGDFGQKVHRRIEFRPATNPANGFQNGALPVSNGKVASKMDTVKKPDDQVSGPLPGLFDPAVVSKYMHWETVSRAGPGLFNNGNTCFLNSTLQCLLHTPAFTQVLLKDSKTALKGLEREDNQQKTVIQLYQRYFILSYNSG
jgi:ubiquitin C-terminal hydrolase